MDTLREIFDAMNSRIRSPIFGSIAVMFIVLNWKPLFYLTFAEANVVDKFQYFDQNTTFWSVIFFPLISGLAFALASPWISLFSLWAAEEPTTRRKVRQTNSADKILTQKMHLEQKRTQLQAQLESARIAEAKRDEEIKSIDNKDIREELEKDINEIRETSSRFDVNNNSNEYERARLERLKTKIEYLQKERESQNTRGEWDRVKEIDDLIKDAIEKIDTGIF